MAVIAIKGDRREAIGKGGARKARAAGQIPGVLYGHGEDPIALKVDSREFITAMRAHSGGNPIINLKLSGADFTALLRDVQYDPLTHGVLHVDFQHISLTETIEVNVNIHLIGLPIGVKDGGGILEHNLREVEVRCLPTAIPPSIEVDVTHLAIGDSVHVRDLQVPNVTILTDADAPLATVVPPTVMEEKTAEAAAAAAEPEVITAKKKDEEPGDKDKKDGGKDKKDAGKEKKDKK